MPTGSRSGRSVSQRAKRFGQRGLKAQPGGIAVSLGMAPLAGLEQHPMAPAWHRIGSFVFRHGEHFYNFEGLRQYKSKFDPQWSARYLACAGGFPALRALIDTSVLIAGGLREVVSR